ncbi:MAG: hypothetical protein MR835_01315 [Erysipelotrichaceae bacterium]|nr:hypothetical protein [Erysipelotrichaceae bacterium]
MKGKKIEVVELNKKEEKIILEEKKSKFAIFIKRYNKLMILLLMLLSLVTVVGGVFLAVSKIQESLEPNIKEVAIDTTLDKISSITNINGIPITDEAAKNIFNKNNIFITNGEVLLENKLETSNFIVKYYSDGTAIKILTKTNTIIRVAALTNGEYGIDKDGNINTSAKTREVKESKVKDYPWGKVIYYSDGSASIINSKMDMFIRNASDIKDNYISNNKVTYLKDTEKVGNTKINYYYDGTIEVVKDNTSYVFRNIDDITLTQSSVEFKNNNQATIYKTINTDDGKTINYYTDGGAIILDGTRSLSVRKSNSIIIKNNKIYEIVDNIYVEISKKTSSETYYTNGSATVDYNNKKYYVEENSNISYDKNNQIKNINGSKEELVQNSDEVDIYEKTAIVKKDNKLAIVPKDNILLDTDGKLLKIKELDTDNLSKTFSVTNNTNEDLSYRVVIEKSDKSTLLTDYIKYQLSVDGTYIGPTWLNDTLWKKDKIYNELKVTKDNYILLDGTIKKYETKNISLILWTDYEKTPNAMQNKQFLGTIKIYAWTKVK